MHAGTLLPRQTGLELMVVVLAGDEQQAHESCARLRQLPCAATVPLIAVLTDDAPLSPDSLPAGVVAWLHASQIATELIPRWRQCHQLQVGAPPVPPADSEDDPAIPDRRQAVHGEHDEWLLVDPQSLDVLDVSLGLAGYGDPHAAQVVGAPLTTVLQFATVTTEAALAAADGTWYPCTRKSTLGVVGGSANVRRVQCRDRPALEVIFRGDRTDISASAALSLVSMLFAPGAGAEARNAAASVLVDGLKLDYLAVWSAHDGVADGPVQLLQHWNGQELAWSPLPLQTTLQQVLGGKAILYPSGARRLVPADPFLQQLALCALFGLPLFDERKAVIGALIAGRQSDIADMAVVEPVLRCAAARFAQELELRRTREQGRAEGLVDTLTRLPNRLLFNDRLATILREAVRNGECFAVLFVDLDNSKAVNDTSGHAAGDEVLRLVARRLGSSIRASDTVARYAGDEFTIVLRHIVKNDDVSRVAEKIVQSMAPSLYLEDGTELQLTASVGNRFFPEAANDVEALIKHADEAMYAAKHLGRNNFHVYEVSPEYAREHGMALRARLRHAEGNGELRVVYQPQVDTESEDIVGMEALVRWEHPELGLVSPAAFVPLAEETGLIVSIGEWVLRNACRQAQEWEERYGLGLRLGVNLSAVQLMEPTLLDTVTRALRDTGLDPAMLELEITESISIKTAPNLIENLHALHKLGCRLAIDDFGTGAASLDYLRRLPADRIKVDQSFVRNIGVDPDDEAIVRATIEMAHRLNRTVVADGVETEQHLQFLRAEHCDELQGYLFARPLQPVSFGTLLAERERLLEMRVAQPA
jgi:diguanylate cyclase (GGDEF)-like protein